MTQIYRPNQLAIVPALMAVWLIASASPASAQSQTQPVSGLRGIGGVPSSSAVPPANAPVAATRPAPPVVQRAPVLAPAPAQPVRPSAAAQSAGGWSRVQPLPQTAMGQAPPAPTLARTAVAPQPRLMAGQQSVEEYLGRGVWRAGSCPQTHNFQTFRFAPARSVEVGSGTVGSGEVLEMLSASRNDGFVEVQTRVCAPVGCNQTFEVYKILGPDQIQEWRFEGRLPNRPPNVVVVDGRASDGSAGRIFNRCAN